MKTRPAIASVVTTALIYTRVSTDEQARDGLSLDTQFADCRRYVAGRDGWVFGRRALERVRCREELRTLGVATHSAREVSDLVANMLAVVAQEEAERLGQRVRDVIADTTANGWAKPGLAAFGYRWRQAADEERSRGAPKSVRESDPGAAALVREVFDRAGPAPRRDVLGLLVERLEAVRQGYGRFELRMVWSPFGQALAQYRGLAVEAA